MNGNNGEQIGDTLKFIQQVLKDTLSRTIMNKKFTGQIVFTINCTDGGITSNNGEIKQVIKK